MIYEIFGLPGSGKTTTLCAIGQSMLMGKRFLDFCPENYERVLSTFPCRGLQKLNFEDIKMYDISNSLILCDEISLYIDNRNFKNFDSELLYFFKMHRHYNIDFVWCSQNYADAERKKRGVLSSKKGGGEFMTIGESLIEVMTETVVNLLNDGGIQMFIDDIKKSQLLEISYGEYMALKKDFYSADEEKALRATVKMAELMQKASDKIKEEKRD